MHIPFKQGYPPVATPKPDTKRDQILAAATRVIAMHGVAAPTAAIAKEAGVANGSLFNAFPTKADLLNQLYRELKTEMATIANNIANVGTSGFKRSRVAFGDIISTSALQNPNRIVGSGTTVRAITPKWA